MIETTKLDHKSPQKSIIVNKGAPAASLAADLDVMGGAIEQGAGEALGAKDLGPFLEGQIAGQIAAHRPECVAVAWTEGLEHSSASLFDKVGI